jgi:hypothetical protein
MAERKSFLLRVDANVLDSVRRWADEDLRSLNGQIEFLLRQALKARGRLKTDAEPAEPGTIDAAPPGELD